MRTVAINQDMVEICPEFIPGSLLQKWAGRGRSDLKLHGAENLNTPPRMDDGTFLIGYTLEVQHMNMF